MAATQSAFKTVQWPTTQKIVVLSVLVSEQSETITHGGPARVPDNVRFAWVQQPTNRCAITPYWHQDSDSTTAVTVSAVTEAGGDITGAELQVTIEWYGDKYGGTTVS